MSEQETGCVWERGIHDDTNDHWCVTHEAWSDDHPPAVPADGAGGERDA